MSPASSAQGRPLSGIVVLDLSRLFPGGFCTLQLADLGARVIKIEEPGVGDFYRATGAPALLGEGYYQALNRNKESLSLNLKSKAGKAIFLKLVAQADVVVESFRPGRLDKLGLGYHSLKRRNKGIIVCSITGYGQTGPRAQEAGHDLNYMATAGLMSLTGDPNKPNVLGFQLADMAGGGLYGAFAILAALQARNRTRKGTWIDLSMTEGALSLAGVHLSGMAWDNKWVDPASGLLDGGAASYNVYTSKDGAPFALAALEPKFWELFQKVTKLRFSVSSGFDKALFSTNVHKRVAKLFSERTRAAWMKLARKFDICLSPIQGLSAVLKDPQFKVRHLFGTISGPSRRKIPFVRLPFLWQGRRLGSIRRAPGLGADNERILRGLGFRTTQIKQLEKEGVL